MSSIPNSKSSRRSLRHIHNSPKQDDPPPIASAVLNATGQDDTTKSKKRKTGNELRSGQNLSWKNRKPVLWIRLVLTYIHFIKYTVGNQKTTNEIETSLDEAGVSVGGKTSRERLLDLLNRHVKPKRPRLSSDRTTRILSKKEEKKKKTVASLSTKTTVATSGSRVDFSIYHVSDLDDMLQKVGLDTRGLDREALIKSCRAYSDLSELSICCIRVLLYTTLTWDCT